MTPTGVQRRRDRSGRRGLAAALVRRVDDGGVDGERLAIAVDELQGLILGDSKRGAAAVGRELPELWETAGLFHLRASRGGGPSPPAGVAAVSVRRNPSIARRVSGAAGTASPAGATLGDIASRPFV